MNRKNIIFVSAFFLIIASAVVVGINVLLDSSSIKSCTLAGCQDNLRIELPEKPIDEGNITHIVIDGTHVSECEDPRNEIREEFMILDPNKFNHTDNDELVSNLRVGYSKDCESEIHYEYYYRNLKINYNDYRPNGDGCPPTCMRGSLELYSNETAS